VCLYFIPNIKCFFLHYWWSAKLKRLGTAGHGSENRYWNQHRDFYQNLSISTIEAGINVFFLRLKRYRFYIVDEWTFFFFFFEKVIFGSNRFAGTHSDGAPCRTHTRGGWASTIRLGVPRHIIVLADGRILLLSYGLPCTYSRPLANLRTRYMTVQFCVPTYRTITRRSCCNKTRQLNYCQATNIVHTLAKFSRQSAADCVHRRIRFSFFIFNYVFCIKV